MPLQLPTKARLVPSLALLVLFFLFALPAASQANCKIIEQLSPFDQSALRAQIEKQGSVRVIVGLNTPFRPEGKLTHGEVKDQRMRIAAIQDKVLSRARGEGMTAVKRYRFIPYMALSVDQQGLRALEGSRSLCGVRQERVAYPELANSVPLIGADKAWTSGYSGAGQAVAILDTGVDKNHLFLPSKVVAEACYSGGEQNTGNFCPDGDGVYEGAGINCPIEIYICFHGTFVAGIAAGNGDSIGEPSGVAKDAKLISIQVTSQIFDTAVAYESDIISGLEQVYAFRNDFDIASVNMSLGGSTYRSACDSDFPAIKAAIDNLGVANTATVVAAGNRGVRGELSWPACVSSAVSVGATESANQTSTVDTVASFSNRSPNMSLWAPGEYIRSSVLGGMPDDDFASKRGTSAAAPHVAGAWAVLKSQRPDATVDQILGSLTDTGKLVSSTYLRCVTNCDDDDDFNDVYADETITKPRIQVDAALGCAPPRWDCTYDLLNEANVRIDGAAGGDQAGYSVSDTGDVNGDGIGDVIIGAPWARTWSGSAFAVFGQVTPAPTLIDLNNLGAHGFRIDGGYYVSAGWSVGGGGDTNGDGLADLIVGAPACSPFFGTPWCSYWNFGRASAYVVYGKASPTTVNLANIGWGDTHGFQMVDHGANNHAGESVASAGDINGDGRPDVIVGDPDADNNGRTDSGSAYVVYGKSSIDTVDLANLGSQGFRIDGAAGSDRAGWSVADAGDVNGDGRPDVIVGAPYADNNGRSESGSAYVVYGKDPADPTLNNPVDLANLGSQGFRIDGAAAADYAGKSVAVAGDVNGDGRPDVIVGAPYADNNGRSSSGSAYVVYGKASTTTVDLANVGQTGDTEGVRIDGAAAGDKAGYFRSVASGGDVNGDGRPDVIVGAPYADNNSRTDSGSAYIVNGFVGTP